MKRVLKNCILAVLLFLNEVFTWICLALDNLFFPGYKKLEMKPPLFIIGMFRGATTLCFNLMANDSSRFTAMKLWEILFAPSVIQKKLFNFIIRLDHKMNRILYKTISRINKNFFLSMENNHPMSLFNREEDHFLFTHTFNLPGLAPLFPRSKGYIVLKKMDGDVSEKKKKSHMKFYKGCIQRHLYVYGEGRQYLSKSPINSTKIRTLQSFFPGCQFIYLLRDPLTTIASTISLLKQFRELFTSKTDIPQLTSFTLSMADLFYHYPLISCSDLKDKTLFVFTFNELTKDPQQTIRKIYNQLEIDLTTEMEIFLLQSTGLINNHKMKSKYTPDEYGLTHEMINTRYDYVYRDYPELKG